MFTQGRLLRHLTVSAGLLVYCTAFQSSIANGMEGFYAGGAIGGQYVDVNYNKSVGINLMPPSYMQAEDDSQEGMSTFKAVLGHRWNMTDRTWFSGEADAAFSPDNRITGFLEGTGVGDRDVWPGAWYVEKNYSIGLNAKLGYAPGKDNFLGEAGSIYLVTGIYWLDLTVDAAHDSGVVSGTARRERSETPWLVGAGVEFGSGKRGRFDLRISYTSYEIDFGQGDGRTLTSPELDYDFEIEEWGIYLGYNWSFGFGLSD